MYKRLVKIIKEHVLKFRSHLFLWSVFIELERENNWIATESYVQVLYQIYHSEYYTLTLYMYNSIIE